MIASTPTRSANGESALVIRTRSPIRKVACPVSLLRNQWIKRLTTDSGFRGAVLTASAPSAHDLVVTGWTLTLAARALREAGATAVLPLALALQA